MKKLLIVDGDIKGVVKEYHQDRRAAAFVFSLETEPEKAGSLQYSLAFDEMEQFTRDTDWNFDIPTKPLRRL